MSVNDFLSSFNDILHLTFLFSWACMLLFVDLFIPKERKGITTLLAVLGLLITMGILITRWGTTISAFNGMVMVDGFSSYLNILLVITGLLAIGVAYDYLKRTGLEHGEYYVLLLFSITGMMLMVGAADLIVIFLLTSPGSAG